MKNNQVKSFTFRVAKESETNAQWKASDDSAAVSCGNRNWDGCGGCTMTQMPWGSEPTTTLGTGGDGPVFC